MSKMGNNDKNKKNVINNGHLLIFSCPCRASRMLTSSRVVASMSTPASLSLSIIFTAYGFPVILWIHFRTTLEIPLLAIKNKFNSYMRTSRNTGKCMGMYRYRIYPWVSTLYLTSEHSKWVRNWIEPKKRNSIPASNHVLFVYYINNKGL